MTAQEPLITVSGYRGVVGQGLRVPEVVRYVAAFAGWLPPGAVVVGRDSRPSGQMLLRAVEAALMATGRTVLTAQIVPTPTLGVLISQHKAIGGVQITASHNPPQYNGLKLLVRDSSTGHGRVLNRREGQQVLKRYKQDQLPWASAEQLGQVQNCSQEGEEHLRRVLQTVGVRNIQARRFQVFVDCNGGAAGPLAVELLRRLGCQVQGVGLAPDGHFRHPPEPTEENLRHLAPEVKSLRAAVGFCLDPDGDRLALLDEQGRYIGEEYTLALCTWHRLSRQAGPVVSNCASSRLTAWLAQRFGVPYRAAAVGEANVVEAMLELEAVYGGEGNGGVIDPRVGLVRDALVGMAQVLDLMASRDQALSQLVAELPPSVLVKQAVPMPPEELEGFLARLQKYFSQAQATWPDGLRLDWSDRWLLVRPSNTEPVVRLIAEAPTRSEAQELVEQALRLRPGGSGPNLQACEGPEHG